eukprot:EG_transcript_15894
MAVKMMWDADVCHYSPHGRIFGMNAVIESNVHDPLAWYFPTFLADELFSVPFGVMIGKGVCSGFPLPRDDRNQHASLGAQPPKVDTINMFQGGRGGVWDVNSNKTAHSKGCWGGS